MGTTIRVIAVLAAAGLAAVIGINVYDAGVSAGLAEAASRAVSSGATAVLVYPASYIGHPGGFGFFGFLFLIFGFFLVLRLLGAAFGRGRWGGHGLGKHWGDRREYMSEWHRQAHGEVPPADQAS